MHPKIPLKYFFVFEGGKNFSVFLPNLSGQRKSKKLYCESFIPNFLLARILSSSPSNLRRRTPDSLIKKGE